MAASEWKTTIRMVTTRGTTHRMRPRMPKVSAIASQEAALMTHREKLKLNARRADSFVKL